HFGEGSSLPSLLLELPPNKVASSKIEDWPGISALGICCADLLPEIEDNRPRQEYADGDYDELGWNP
ncbi:MAG: hypothetical protein QGG48_10665, partial [Desulfatiglandales bacterium]|nr:hypothetical protein [Desulfatiglandales bacterium]